MDIGCNPNDPVNIRFVDWRCNLCTSERWLGADNQVLEIWVLRNNQKIMCRHYQEPSRKLGILLVSTKMNHTSPKYRVHLPLWKKDTKHNSGQHDCPAKLFIWFHVGDMHCIRYLQHMTVGAILNVRVERRVNVKTGNHENILDRTLVSRNRLVQK